MKRLTPAKLSMLMFGLVGLLVVAYISKRMFAVSDVRPEVRTRTIPLALADLEPGSVITSSDIGMGPVVESQLEPTMLLNRDTIVGRVVKERIPAASPVRTSNLYKSGEMPPLKLAPGMQAVTVSIGDNTGLVNGLVKPNDYVDILMTPNSRVRDDRLDGGMTLTLFRGIRLVAINRNLSGAGGVTGGGNAVTLELTADQARVITLAQQNGVLKLVYNPDGPGDGNFIPTRDNDRVTLEEILRLEPLPEEEPPAEPFQTEHFRGGARVVVQFRGTRRLDYNRGIQVRRNPNDPDDATAPGTTPNNGPTDQPNTIPPTRSNSGGAPDSSTSDFTLPADRIPEV